MSSAISDTKSGMQMYREPADRPAKKRDAKIISEFVEKAINRYEMI